MADKTTGYVLNKGQSDYLQKAVNLQDTVLHGYINVDEDKLKTAEMQTEMLQAVCKAFKEKRISCRSLLRYYNRLQSLKYWSLSLTNIEINKGDDKHTAYSFEIVSNIEDINGRTVRTDDNPEAFGTTDIKKQASLLQIPEDTLYISHADLFALDRLRPVCLYATESIPEDGKDFWSMKSSPVLDVFSGVGSPALKNKELQQSDFGGKDMYEIVSATGVRLYIDKDQYSPLLFRSPNMDKLIKQLNHKAMTEGYRSKTVTLTLAEIMDARGVTDRKELNKSIVSALNGLFSISLTYANSQGDFKKRRIIQAIDGNDGHGRGHSAQYSVTYSDDYWNHMRTTPQVAQLPTEILKIPNNQPNAYYFATAFYEQKRRNAGKPYGIENKLSVKRLLCYAGIRSYDELKDKAQAAQLIIEPFIKALDYLEDKEILTYELQHSARDATDSNGVTLTDEELDRVYRDYAFFSSLVVKVTWRKEADYTHLLQAKQGRLAQANKKRGRKKQPAKDK